MVTVSKIDTTDAFDALAPEWDRLVAANDTNNVFLSHAWLSSWWHALAAGHSLYLLVVRADDAVIGVAPLMLTLGGLPGRKQKVLQFLGTPNADYADIIGPDKKLIVAQVCHYLVAHRDDWDTVELSQISGSSATIPLLEQALKEVGACFQVREIETCMQYVYEGPEEKRAQFQLPRKTTLKRSMKQLEQVGGLTLEHVTDTTQILAYMPAFFHAHIVRWDDTVTPSKFLKPAYRVFYENLVKNLGPSGNIDFLVLRHGRHPLGYFFTYYYQNTAYLYTLVHNRFFSKYSPGNILITLMVDHCVRNGYALVDHTRGAKAHKGIFANREAKNFRVTIFRNSGARLAALCYERVKQTALLQKLAANRTWSMLKTKVSVYYSDNGFGALYRAVARRLIRPFWEYQMAIVLEHRGTLPADVPLRPEVTIEQLHEKDVEKIAFFLGFEPGSRKHQTIEKRFADGSDCFALRFDGRLASLSWGLFKKDYLPGFDRLFPLKENEVLFADDFTSPLFRGLGLHPAGIRYKLHYYAPRNLRVLTMCLKHNVTAQKGFIRSGFEPIGKIRHLKICGIRIL